MKLLAGLKTWVALAAAGGTAPVVAQVLVARYGLTMEQALWFVAAVPTAVGAAMRTISASPFLGGLREWWTERKERRNFEASLDSVEMQQLVDRVIIELRARAKAKP